MFLYDEDERLAKFLVVFIVVGSIIELGLLTYIAFQV